MNEDPAPDPETIAPEQPAEDAEAPDADREAAQAAEAIPAAPRPPTAGRLRRDRRRLVGEREEAVYHLGGLAFELYRRDLLQEGIMRTRAGEVAQLDDTVRDIDARLGEIDRTRRDRSRRGGDQDAVGACLTCRTPFQAQARFCWQCGAQVVPPPLGGDDQVTAVIPSPAR